MTNHSRETPLHRALGLPDEPLSWTAIEQVVASRVSEQGDLDWKRDLYHPKDPKWWYEAGKDMAAMANSGGGWIVFGVSDVDDRADEIVGVEWSSGQAQRLRQVGAQRVLPPLTGLEFYPVSSPTGDRTVVCMRVPEGRESKHAVCPEQNAFKVPYRNGPDTEFHGPREVGLALLAFANGGMLPAQLVPEATEHSGPVNHLKAWVLDPTKGVALHDLVMAEVQTVLEAIEGQPLSVKNLDGEQFQTVLESHRETVEPLVALVITGIWHDQSGVHDQVWVDALQRLVTSGMREVQGQPYMDVLLKARLYPALLLFLSAALASVVRGREALLIRLSTEVTALRRDASIRQPGCQVLHPWMVLDADWINSMPRWGGGRWTYPASHLLKADIRPFFSDLVPDDTDFTVAFHGVEYRLSILQERSESLGYRAMPGEYVGELGWTYGHPSVPHAEVAFENARQRSVDWPWTDILGDDQSYPSALAAHRAVLEKYQYHRMR